MMLIFMLFFAAFCNDRVDECNNLFIYLMCFKDRLNHYIFRHFIGASLNHDNFFSRRGHSQ